MTVKRLDEDILVKVIESYKKPLEDNRTAPGKAGKESLFKYLVERDDFLPKDIQEVIDKTRGKTAMPKFLLGHQEFYFEFRTYLNGYAGKCY